MATNATLDSVLATMLSMLKELKDQRDASMTATSTPSKEVAMEALARGILTFTYDPEQNLTFDTWYQRYRSTFLEDGKNLDDSARLLTKLETESPETINLEFMLVEAKRLLNVKNDSKVENPSVSVSSVQKRGIRKERPPRPCYQCGSMHFVRECPHSESKCLDCGKTGHKTGYCPPQRDPGRQNSKSSKQQKKSRLKSKGKSNARTNAIFSPRQFGRKFIIPRINDCALEFQLDCAADISVISRESWEILGKPSLSQSAISVRDAQSQQIPIDGEFKCHVSILDKEIVSRCLVSPKTRTNLFGIEWIEALGLWDIAPSKYCNSIKRDLDTTEAVRDLQKLFPVVFGTEIGLCTKVTATIHLKPNSTPVFRPKRPVAYHMTSAIDDELQRLQSSGIISPVEYSEWAAPIVVVKKPNGSLRICGDYSTGLNESVETNHHPIPEPDALFSNLSNKRLFSHIDLSDAYLQIPVDEDSSKLLTIHTPRGLYRFNRLPPGIRSAPGIFQGIVERMLQGIPDVVSYFDDICVASATPEEHFSTLKRVFERLQEFNFRVKLEKYKDGLRPDPEKINAIKMMPAPKNVQELRSFLGAIQFWGKFVQSMSELRAPLDYLLKKGVKWSWTRECEESFNRFKDILGSELLLTHYNPQLPILVASDASSHAIGCVAYHEFPDGTQKSFYHASRKLTDTESRYSQIEKEALGIIFAVKKFHRFIYGRQFTLLTDHKPLVSIFGNHKGIPVHTANRLQRWALILLAYDFTIKYTATDRFGHADILSRLISSRRQQQDDVVIAEIRLDEAQDDAVVRDAASQLPVSFKMIQNATKSSESFQEVSKFITGGWPSSTKAIKSREVLQFYKIRDALSLIKGCVFYRDRLEIPESLRPKILQQLHESHPGMSRTKSLARGYVYWPGLDDAIEKKVRNCTDCALASKSPVKTPLATWPLPSRPWQRLHIDYAKYKGEYFFLVIDAFSKWPEIFKTRSMTTAHTISRLREIFARFGLPETLVSDNGTQFVNEMFSHFCKTNGIVHLRTTPYTPASNGQCERLVDTFKRSLEKQKNSQQSLDDALQQFLANYRVTPNENAPEGKSPSEIIFSRKIRTIFDLLRDTPEEPIRRNEKMEEEYNRRHGAKKRIFEKGEEVYAKIFSPGRSFKWTPGVVIERRGSVQYNIRLGNGTIIRSHTNQLKHRFSETQDALPLFTSTQQTQGTHSASPLDTSLPLQFKTEPQSSSNSVPGPSGQQQTPQTPQRPEWTSSSDAETPPPSRRVLRRRSKNVVPKRLSQKF
ncbi:uncharacterized protein K02A2.6-like [Phlebotomus papatasi]|uniref:uncharacterized protein K02A2.6-like n=1 Tax=Phlebotomus papatasi TaxID=29031 RepID=UPI002483C97E|nr:uncharacterized protein K02A2.6-like [Phlebotomus papatasi]